MKDAVNMTERFSQIELMRSGKQLNSLENQKERDRGETR